MYNIINNPIYIAEFVMHSYANLSYNIHEPDHLEF